jgi:hypothetical protein
MLAQSISKKAEAMRWSFWVLASFRLSLRVFKPAPSPKPHQNPKILAAHRYIFFVNALARRGPADGGARK